MFFFNYQWWDKTNYVGTCRNDDQTFLPVSYTHLTDLLAEVVKSENDRTTAENIRITNEKDRQDHEAERQENERVRKNAENARIANEDKRTSHFNDMIRIADEKTKEAENVNIEAWATPCCLLYTSEQQVN